MFDSMQCFCIVSLHISWRFLYYYRFLSGTNTARSSKSDERAVFGIPESLPLNRRQTLKGRIDYSWEAVSPDWASIIMISLLLATNLVMASGSSGLWLSIARS